jgi:hypothetical protein
LSISPFDYGDSPSEFSLKTSSAAFL